MGGKNIDIWLDGKRIWDISLKPPGFSLTPERLLSIKARRLEENLRAFSSFP
jgi:hypothetical protein